jgi:hypothetical protein
MMILTCIPQSVFYLFYRKTSRFGTDHGDIDLDFLDFLSQQCHLFRKLYETIHVVISLWSCRHRRKRRESYYLPAIDALIAKMPPTLNSPVLDLPPTPPPPTPPPPNPNAPRPPYCKSCSPLPVVAATDFCFVGSGIGVPVSGRLGNISYIGNPE